MSFPNVALDPGELDLIIYAGSLKSTANVWFLNSPDMAAVRHAHTRNWLDRLVSLEAMANHLKLKLASALRNNYTEEWLKKRRLELVFGRI